MAGAWRVARSPSLTGGSRIIPQLQRRSRDQPQVGNAIPVLPNVVFTRLRLLLDYSKGLAVIEGMEKLGAVKKYANNCRAVAAAFVGGSGKQSMRKMVEERRGWGGGTA